jgi:uncharacterized protein YjbI with pentapeptide repeats
MTGRDAKAEKSERFGWSVVDWSKLSDPPIAVSSFVFVLAFLLALAAFVLAAILLVRVFDAAVSGAPDDINKLLLGLGALIGAPFLVWRVLIAAQQTVIARETMYTTLFTKAVEQLGAMREIREPSHEQGMKAALDTKIVPNTEVRLGAIYALERIAQDSERDHWPIMETLCAYVRENAGAAVRETEAIKKIRQIAQHERTAQQHQAFTAWEERRNKTVSIDVQAALNVLGRRSASRINFEEGLRSAATTEDACRLDLSGANLPHVVLSGMNFEHADFSRSNLKYARFENAKLSKSLFQCADLCRANFGGADCYGSWLQSAEADGAVFAQCSLRSACLAGIEFGNSSFLGAELSGAILYRADLSASLFLEQDQLEQTDGDGSTTLPAGLRRPGSWIQGLAMAIRPTKRSIAYIRGLSRDRWEIT